MTRSRADLYVTVVLLCVTIAAAAVLASGLASFDLRESVHCESDCDASLAAVGHLIGTWGVVVLALTALVISIVRLRRRQRALPGAVIALVAVPVLVALGVYVQAHGVY